MYAETTSQKVFVFNEQEGTVNGDKCQQALHSQQGPGTLLIVVRRLGAMSQLHARREKESLTRTVSSAIICALEIKPRGEANNRNNEELVFKKTQSGAPQ